MEGPLEAKRVRRCHLLGPGAFLMVMVVVVLSCGGTLGPLGVDLARVTLRPGFTRFTLGLR